MSLLFLVAYLYYFKILNLKIQDGRQMDYAKLGNIGIFRYIADPGLEDI